VRFVTPKVPAFFIALRFGSLYQSALDFATFHQGFKIVNDAVICEKNALDLGKSSVTQISTGGAITNCLAKTPWLI